MSPNTDPHKVRLEDCLKNGHPSKRDNDLDIRRLFVVQHRGATTFQQSNTAMEKQATC